MSDKVKELVDWVAAYIYKSFSTWKEPSYYDLSELNKAGWREYAKDILKHPDLALIDREKEVPEQIYNQDEHRYYLKGNLHNCLPVIPLAEAIEKENAINTT